jgi:hypothetical protein
MRLRQQPAPSGNPFPAGRTAAGPLAWILAVLLGLALAATSFPLAFLLPSISTVPNGDAAQHAIAQRYFIGDAWRWPLLLVPALGAPDGMNIAFLDGIPLQALVLKLLRGVLPQGFHGTTLWYGIAWLLQPVAALWALRGTGERRLLPLCAVMLLAVSMPVWWNRFGHAALTSHFLLLAGLGCYLRLVTPDLPPARRDRLWPGAGLLLVLALLIHPYLAVMVLALLGAVPATLLLRGAAGWWRHALWLGGAVVALLAAMLLLQYLGAKGDPGFGLYALNLLSPFWPHGSRFFPDLAAVDASGFGGWEGYNYLGAGVLLGLLAALLLAPSVLFSLLRRHAGLAVVLAGLTLLSLSHRVGLGNRLLLDLGTAPGFLEQFRSSGRFFWPAGYAVMLGVAALIARLPWRRGGPLLLAALALLQFLEVAPLRHRLERQAAATYRPPLPDAAALAPLLPGLHRLTLLPSWICGAARAEDVDANHQLLLDIVGLAALHQVPVNTMYPARWYSPPRCDDAETAGRPLEPGELRVILPAGTGTLMSRIPDAASNCRGLRDMVLCQAGGPGGYRPRLPPRDLLAFARGGSGEAFLGRGWAEPEGWGVWSAGPEALLYLPPQPPGPVQLRLRVQGFGPAPGEAQPVELRLGGQPVGRWSLRDFQVTDEVLDLPGLPPGDTPAVLSLRPLQPTSPAQRGLNGDGRRLGIGLVELRVLHAP